MNNHINGPVFIATEGYDALSRAMARMMADCVSQKPDALICLASGHSTLEAYRLFVQLVADESIDVSKMRVIKLDEWLGMPMDHPASCQTFLEQHVIRPLRIPADRCIAFDSSVEDPEAECRRVAGLLAEQGPIDLCLLGIGKNGHLGLNEPGELLQPFTHTVVLDERTQGHAMLKETDFLPTRGMTIGLADIMASRSVVLGITGSGKEAAYSRFMAGQITTMVPATFLWLHPRATCLVDTAWFSIAP